MSDSNSQQTNAPITTDNRAVLGQDAMQARDGSSINSTSYVLDNGAVNHALQFAADAGAGANDLSRGALTAAGDALRQAFNFGADAQAGALATVNSNVGSTMRSAMDFASDTQAGALATVNSNVGSTLRSALDFASDTQVGALSGIADAVRQALNFGGDAMAFNADALGRVLDASTHSTEQAMQGLHDTESLVAAAYNDAKGRGAMTDKLLMAAVGAMALVAFMAVKK